MDSMSLSHGSALQQQQQRSPVTSAEISSAGPTMLATSAMTVANRSSASVSASRQPVDGSRNPVVSPPSTDLEKPRNLDTSANKPEIVSVTFDLDHPPLSSFQLLGIATERQRFQDRISSLERSLAEEREVSKRLEGRLRECLLQQTTSPLKDQRDLEIAKKINDVLTAEAKKVHSELDRLRQESSRLKEVHTLVSTQLELAEARIQDLLVSRSVLEEKLLAERSSSLELGNKLQISMEQLRESAARHANSSERLEQLSKQMGALEHEWSQKLEILSADRDHWQHECNVSRAENDKLMAMFKDLRQEATMAAEEARSLFAEDAVDIARLRSRVAELERDLESSSRVPASDEKSPSSLRKKNVSNAAAEIPAADGDQALFTAQLDKAVQDKRDAQSALEEVSARLSAANDRLLMLEERDSDRNMHIEREVLRRMAAFHSTATATPAASSPQPR